jgi:hypothetical protein
MTKPPPALLNQQATTSSPGSVTLDEVVLWDFSLTFWVEGSAAIDVLWNESVKEAYTMTLEDSGGIAQIRITAASEDARLPRVVIDGMTAIVSDDVYRFQREDGSFLELEEAARMQARTLIFERLDVRSVQSAKGTVDGVSFATPVIPAIVNDTELEVGTGSDTFAGHLTSLLRTLLGSSPFAMQLVSLECRYGYQIGGVEVAAPVVLLPKQELATGTDDLIVGEIGASVEQWLEAVQPPAHESRWLFAISLWSGVSGGDAPMLRLGNVVLPAGRVLR